jgi:cytochrome c oxidase assembly protein subunit 15
VKPALNRLAVAGAFVALAVIVLGAWVRLSHAGLGCPDWPGCYGQLTWPVESHEIVRAEQAFPERPVETHKAWKEMIHRYLAGALVLLVAVLNVLAWRQRDPLPGVRLLTGTLLILILFQAALGMWTVTLKLKPVVVMAHLLGGLMTFALLLWLAWMTSPRALRAAQSGAARLRPLILAGLGMLVLQLALGGWTSANYAALACPDFPTCQGEWWPETNFGEGFVLWREIGVDYEGGVLDLPSRTAIHMAHRVGALVTIALLGLLAWRLLRESAMRREGVVLLALLAIQVTLGIQNVLLFLPLANAVAHNGVGALLLATLLWLAWRSTPEQPVAPVPKAA